MDLPWGDEKSVMFVTNVGLVTSKGPHGDNIMACEWTHHVSYSPGLIAISVGKGKATWENINSSKEFGVSLASIDQSVLASVSGGSTGKSVDKIAVLKDLGFEFYKAKKIKTLMVKDASVNIECKVVNIVDSGDHTLFIGEVLDAKKNEKEPLVYHGLKYFKLGENISKPPQDKLDKIKKLVEKHPKH